MTVGNVHTATSAREATNDNAPLSSRPGLVTEREAIATFLNDGFSLEQATLLWRLLVQVEREERNLPDEVGHRSRGE